MTLSALRTIEAARLIRSRHRVYRTLKRRRGWNSWKCNDFWIAINVRDVRRMSNVIVSRPGGNVPLAQRPNQLTCTIPCVAGSG